MTAPLLRDADVVAVVAVVAVTAATVVTGSAVEAVEVAAEATSMVNAVAVVVAVAVAVVVNADKEDLTVKMAKSKAVVAVVVPMAMTGIAEVEEVTSIAVRVEEAVVIVALVIVVHALREKAARVVAAEEKEETLMNAMDISKVTDKMAPAVDVVETARVATREVAGVTRLPVKRARSSQLKRAREPLTLLRKKRRRLLAENLSLSKKRKKLASPLMTTWHRSRLTQRVSLVKRRK